MNFKQVVVLGSLLISATPQASLFTPFSKIVNKVSGKKTSKPVSANVAIQRFSRGQIDNNALINYKVIANDGEVRDAPILVQIDDKLIESDLRNMNLIETFDEYLPTSNRFRANYITEKIQNAVQLNVHNHLVLRDMDSGERAAYIQVHKDNVETLLIHLQQRLPGTSGPGRFIENLENHVRALKQVHFDINSL